MRATRKLQHIAPSRYLSPSLIIEVASFSLYFFTWKLCMSVTLGRTPRLADPGVIGNVYAILLAFTGLGYVLFWVAGAYLPGSMEKRTAAAAAMSLCVTGAIGMVATLRLPGFLIASCATILALGYLGAAVHHGFSLVSYESEVSGRALGIGMGVASLLEYLVETLRMTPAVFVVCVILSALAILWLDGRPARRWLYDHRPSPQQVSGVSRGVDRPSCSCCRRHDPRLRPSRRRPRLELCKWEYPQHRSLQDRLLAFASVRRRAV